MNDWFANAIEEDIREEAQPEFDLSSEWCNEWMRAPGQVTESLIDHLVGLKSSFQTFARLLGVNGIEFRWATNTDLGTGCAFFRTKLGTLLFDPVVVIDTAMFKACTTSLDPLYGCVLHEIGHILFTKLLFRMTHRNQLARGVGKILTNLLEDNRIEREMLVVAPGYGRYLSSARQAILIDGWLQRTLKDWSSLGEYPKRLSLMMAFIRCPRAFREMPDLMEWQSSDGEIFFELVRKVLRRAPTSENHVIQLARKLLKLVPNPPSPDETTESKSAPKDTEMEQLQATVIEIESILDQSSRCSEAMPKDVLSALIERETGDPKSKPVNIVLKCRTLANCDSRIISFQRAAILPSMDSKWRQVRDSLRQPIAVLQSHVVVHDRTRRFLLGGLQQGQLNARDLWRAPFDSRVFASTEVRNSDLSRRCTFAILLDASGSMWDQNRYEQAFKMAVLLVEGFESSAVEVRLFSHNYDDDKIVVTEHVQPRRSMHNYFPRGGNVDSQAILHIGSILRDTGGQKVLLVVSDGQPCSHRNGNAVQETRKAVADVRATGIAVFGINLGDKANGSIYGRDSMQLRDAQTLPREVASLMIRELHRILE